jgi:hypothetical protein
VVRRHGLAAYLVAGPALQRKLTTARHAAGEAPCPEGVAVVHAAIDWARCGRTDPIDHDILRRLWTAYLPVAESHTAVDGFDTALDWALRPVAASVALLYRARDYQAFDYVIRIVASNSTPRPRTSAPGQP